MAWVLLGMAIVLTLINNVWSEAQNPWLTFKRRQYVMGAAWLVFLLAFIASYFL